ncbi:MAG: DUF401 family protein [Selenomonadaceae bacterium]|nr:DUF401 family protein [Selenomonadaceae bacterium]
MNIFVLLIIAMAIIIFFMRKKVAVGKCLIIGGLFMWAVRSLNPELLLISGKEMLLLPRTYDLMFSLYFVMCLEIELRTSGVLSDMVSALQRIFSSGKAILAVMPGFLGLLPSVGGARFSAPIVDEGCRNMIASAEEKAAINFWFRHPFEFSNPIIPGMIMACSVTGIGYGDFVIHTAWVTVVCILTGWAMLIAPLKYKSGAAGAKENEVSGDEGSFRDVILAVSPIIITFLLVVFADMASSAAMGISVLLIYAVLSMMGKEISLAKAVKGAMDGKMFLNIACILYFIQLLTETGILNEIIEAFQSAPLPIPVIIAGISIIVGILTGMSQAHVAIVMPIVAAVMPGNLDLAAVAMVFGTAGQMITPTHVCFTVTTDYFNADFLTVLKKMVLIEIIVLTIFSVITYIMW